MAAKKPPPQPRKRRKPRNRPPGEDAAKAARQQQALDLRIAGATYRQIATQLAVGLKTAYLDVHEALAALDAVIADKAERLRDLEAARLDRLNVALAPGIKAGAPSAILAAVRVMERRARLFGLDAPTKLAGPTGEALGNVTIVMQQDKG